jgi:cyclase
MTESLSMFKQTLLNLMARAGTASRGLRGGPEMKSARKILVIALLLAPVAVLAQGTLVQTADPALRGLKESDFPRLQQLEPNVYAYEELRPSDPGKFKTTVDMIVVTSGGVLVADGQGNLAATQKLVAQIKKLTPLAIKYVVVCSEHDDHTGGNAAFMAAFPHVVFVASPVSQKALATSATPPTEAVADKRTIRLGGTDIEILNLGRAHTGGDLSVYVPGSKVLFMSEIYDHRLFPSLARGFPSEWLSTIKKNQAIDTDWVFGGHGFVDDPVTMRNELAAFASELTAVIAEGRRLHDAHVACRSAKDCDAVGAANWGPYENWSERATQAPGALIRVYQEIEGKLPR